jgi:hypothetical protein
VKIQRGTSAPSRIGLDRIESATQSLCLCISLWNEHEHLLPRDEVIVLNESLIFVQEVSHSPSHEEDLNHINRCDGGRRHRQLFTLAISTTAKLTILEIQFRTIGRSRHLPCIPSTKEIAEV